MDRSAKTGGRVLPSSGQWGWIDDLAWSPDLALLAGI